MRVRTDCSRPTRSVGVSSVVMQIKTGVGPLVQGRRSPSDIAFSLRMASNLRRNWRRHIPSTPPPSNEQTAMADRGNFVSVHDSELHQPADVFDARAGIGEDVPFQSLGSVLDFWCVP